MPQHRKKYSTSKDYLSLLVYLYLLVYDPGESKFRYSEDTWFFYDTPQSQNTAVSRTPRIQFDTAESDSRVCRTPRIQNGNSKTVSPVNQGPRWVRFMSLPLLKGTLDYCINFPFSHIETIDFRSWAHASCNNYIATMWHWCRFPNFSPVTNPFNMHCPKGYHPR